MKWFISLWIMIALQWDANSEVDLVGYKLYARASTEPAFKCISTLHKQTEVQVKVDGRRNWYFYVTARNKSQESSPSNIVYVPR